MCIKLKLLSQYISFHLLGCPPVLQPSLSQAVASTLNLTAALDRLLRACSHAFFLQDYFWDVDLWNSKLKSIAIRMDQPLSVNLGRLIAAPQLVYLELTSNWKFVGRWERGVKTAKPLLRDRPFKLVLASDWTQENQHRKLQARLFLEKKFGPSLDGHLPERLRPNTVQGSTAKGEVVYCNQQWISHSSSRNSEADLDQQTRLIYPSAESPLSSHQWFPRGVSHVNTNKVCQQCETYARSVLGNHQN